MSLKVPLGADLSWAQSDQAPVTVLMAVYNGAAHLGAQLDSLAAQAVPWRLIASDDGSQDDSREILARFGRLHRVEVLPGPQQGFAANFMALIAKAPKGAPLALADQDDVWHADKLERALAQLAQVPADHPALYCSRRINWQAESDQKTLSRAYGRAPSFANALVENIAGGNTVVLNAAGAALARAAAKISPTPPYHDWWLYQLITGAGGRVIYDPTPHILYRQHGANQVGQGEGLRRGLSLQLAVAQGGLARRIGQNLATLQAISAHLTPENQQILAKFQSARSQSLPRRLAMMRQIGIYRQTLIGQIGLWGALCFGKI